MEDAKTPKFDHYGFVEAGYAVQYRGSEATQQLTITTKFAHPTVTSAVSSIRTILNFVNQGMAGGAEFAPWLGKARVLDGPTDRKAMKALRTSVSSMTWLLEIEAVSPLFMRVMTDCLARAPMLESLSIVGSLAVDDAPLSVTDRKLTPKLSDPDFYPAAWPTPGFVVERVDSPQALTVAVATTVDMDESVAKGLFACIDWWCSSVSQNYATRHRKSSSFGMHLFPKTALKKREILARFEVHDLVLYPSTNALLNALARFHHDVHPIERVVLGESW